MSVNNKADDIGGDRVGFFSRKGKRLLAVTSVLLLVVMSWKLNGGLDLYIFDGYSKQRASEPAGYSTQEDSSPRSSLDQRLEWLERIAPECVAPQRRVDLLSVGLYRQISNTSNLIPRYDHISCTVMKARYNCAYRPDAPFRMAHHQEMVLYLNGNESKPCILRDLVDTIWQGPHGLVEYLSETNQFFHVILQGNSFLRQVWEALVCGFRHQLEKLTLQTGGPGIKMSDFSRRQFRKVDRANEKLGNTLHLSQSNLSLLDEQGCHGDDKGDIAKYFRKKALKPPPSWPKCNDDVASATFHERLAISYIFKPSMYTNGTMDYLYQNRLGVNVTKATAGSKTTTFLLWNRVTEEPQNITCPVDQLISSDHELKMLVMETWMWSLRELQLRHLGRFFGANNPWIRDPPDYHPCMPGIPDDEANLLLYYLWTGFEIY